MLMILNRYLGSLLATVNLKLCILVAFCLKRIYLSAHFENEVVNTVNPV